jgi:hypothetical protein
VYTPHQSRIDAMYVDKLDSEVTTAFFEERAAEWRGEQARIRARIAEHEGAKQSYLEDGIRLLDLSRRAREQFAKQLASEKRKMLDLLLSNSSWEDWELTVCYREPFDIIAKRAKAERALAPTGTREDAKTRDQKYGSAWGATCEPFSPAVWRTARRESRRPAQNEPLRFRRVEAAEPGRASAFAPSSRG